MTRPKPSPASLVLVASVLGISVVGAPAGPPPPARRGHIAASSRTVRSSSVRRSARRAPPKRRSPSRTAGRDGFRPRASRSPPRGGPSRGPQRLATIPQHADGAKSGAGRSASSSMTWSGGCDADIPPLKGRCCATSSDLTRTTFANSAGDAGKRLLGPDLQLPIPRPPVSVRTRSGGPGTGMRVGASNRPIPATGLASLGGS
jgi:hypothetical protein